MQTPIVIVVIWFYQLGRMKNKILTLLLMVMLSTGYIAQGQGNGNGPPNPPPGYCDQFPNDPACVNNIAVPIGSTEGMIIFMFLSGIFFIYKMNGNSLKFKKHG